jgi:Uri superfamily endonuclease
VAIPEGRECAVVETLRTRRGVAFPVPGFGASDCHACPAHLLRVPGFFGAKDLVRGMAPSVLYEPREGRAA